MRQEVADTVKVVGANAAALGITIANINTILTTVSLIAAIAYTMWKWRRDYKRESNDKK